MVAIPSLIVEKGVYGPLISPQRNRDTPVYNWHAFKHSFSKELVDELVSEFNLKEGSWVLDPYCGGGTTLLACKENNINSLGSDILPFSVFLSNVKTRDYNISDLKQRRRNFQSNGNSGVTIDLPDIPIINKAFSPGVRLKLLSIKQKINRIRDPKVRDFYMLGLLNILESLSKTKKSGGFLRLVENDVSPEDVYPAFISRIDQMIDDVSQFNGNSKKVNVSAELSDSRKLKTRKKFDAVITSPPYPNRHDYTRIYGLELIFGFVNSNDELKNIRYETLRSHVEARKKFESNGYKKPPIIDDLITQVKEKGLNNPQVPDMVEGYFEDMYLSLSQMQKHLKDGGKISLVVSNVRFGGVNIPVDEILAGIGEQTGLTTEKIYVARYRGNSAQQMGRYERRPSRESIIIWKK